MVTVVGVVGLAILIGINTLIAAVGTRFFRIALVSRVGTIIYIGFFVPMVLLFTTLFLSGFLGLGFDLEDTYLVLLVAIGIPLVLGIGIDLKLARQPDEVDAVIEDDH